MPSKLSEPDGEDMPLTEDATKVCEILGIDPDTPDDEVDKAYVAMMAGWYTSSDDFTKQTLAELTKAYQRAAFHRYQAKHPAMVERTATKSLIEKPKKDESGKLLGGICHPWRRFFARIFDYTTLAVLALFMVVFIVDYVLGLFFSDKVDSIAKAIDNQIIAGFVLSVLWIPIEAILLSTVGNTPGRWIFGILVRTTSRQKPSFGQALERSFRVLLQGLGLCILPVPLLTLFFAHRRLTKTGTTLWDTATESNVTHKTWGVARAIVCTGAFFLVIILLASLNAKMSDKTPAHTPTPGGGYEFVF